MIFDALADLFGGEENVRRHVRGFIVLLKQLAIRQKLAVILIAHPSLTGMSSGSGLFRLDRLAQRPARPRLLPTAEGQGGQGGRPRPAHPHGYEGSIRPAKGRCFACAVRRASSSMKARTTAAARFDRAASAAKAETVFLALLQAFEEQGRSVSPNPEQQLCARRFQAGNGRRWRFEGGARPRNVQAASKPTASTSSSLGLYVAST